MSEKIMYDSTEAAVYESRTLTGWWSVKSTSTKDARFWGDDEHMARYDGSTHQLCWECGKNDHRKMWTCCRECRAKHDAEQYAKLPKKPWDGESMVVGYKDDNYFNSLEDVYDYCDEHGCKPEGLMLCHCEGVELPQVDIVQHLYDSMGEDQDADDIDADILSAVDELNELISAAKPMCYRQANIAVEYPWATDSASEGTEGRE
jgi:hypothetical protein